MWGMIPADGKGSRIQLLPFSQEMLIAADDSSLAGLPDIVWFPAGGPLSFLLSPMRYPEVFDAVGAEDECRLIQVNMLDCFSTQRETRHGFPVDHECFRRAPNYDFTERPDAGVCFTNPSIGA